MKFQIIKREEDPQNWFNTFNQELTRRFNEAKEKNPKGYADSFEQSINTHMEDTARSLGLPFKYEEEEDELIFVVDASGDNIIQN